MWRRVAVIVSLLWPTGVEGQWVRGVVVESGTRSGVSAAQVVLVTAVAFERVQVVTDTSGRFRLTAPRAGRYVLRVEHLGYLPFESDTLVLGTGESLELEVRLGRTAIPLDPLIVTSRSAGRLAGFDDRRATLPFGRFLTREDLQNRGAGARVTDVLRTVPGVVLVPTRQVSGIIPGYLVRMRGSFGGCEPSLFLDGVPVRQYAESTIDEIVNREHLEAMEIYSSVSAVPVQFSEGGRCGAIVMWTRRGGSEGGRPWSWKRMAVGAGAALVIFFALIR